MGNTKNRSKPEILPAILTVKKAAAVLECEPQQIEGYVKEGRLRPIAKGLHKGKFDQEEILTLKSELVAEKGEIPHDFPVVGIGASAGGLEAVSALLDALPADLGLAYVFISHLNPDHESLLPEILARRTKMPVHKVQHGMALKPDTVFVIPPNCTMSIVDGILTLTEPRIRTDKGFHPINEFMIALAEVYQQRSIGVVLSGTASDGTLGLKAICAAGGWTFAQDDSARFPEMPKSAQDTGAVDFILSPEGIAEQLAVLHKYSGSGINGTESVQGPDEKATEQILSIVHEKFGMDLTDYKKNTIHRRILRRMLLHKVSDLPAYVEILQKDEQERSDLFHDLLINVTSFFREPAFFEALKEKIIPALLKDRKAGQPLRIWVAGCSTGEEAISIAITLLENFEEQLRSYPVQIFGTDLDSRALAKARLGGYTNSATESLSPKRLSQYFTNVDGTYKVIKPIRDMCVFARHDLLHDPPFSRMDLVTCQNVLIYFESQAQRKALKSFQYALQPDGFLALGRSETTTAAADLFHQVDKGSRLYARKGTHHQLDLDLPLKSRTDEVQKAVPARTRETLRSQEGRLDHEMDRLLLHRHIPASILVNKDLDIVRFRGVTAPYMAPHTGRASLNLLKMVREDLMFELRALMKRVKAEKAPVMREGLEIRMSGVVRRVTIEAMPVTMDTKTDHYLVVFRDEALRFEDPASSNDDPDTGDLDPKDKRIAQLQREIRELREQVRVVSEEAQLSTEELQTANEEVLSSNEELQSMNEELETSKEELQSSNEELTTINDELEHRYEELKEARDYAQAIIGTFATPLVIVNSNMRVRMANKTFYDMFRTTPEETEGMLIHELGNHQWEVASLRKNLFDVLSHGTDMHDLEVTHTFPQIGERNINLNARRIEWDNAQHRILMTMEDITERRKAEEAIERLAAIVSSSKDAIVGLDLAGCITSWNEGAVQLFGYTADEVLGRSMEVLLTNEQLGRAGRIKEHLLDEQTRNFDVVRKRKDGSLVDVAITVSPIKLANGNIIGVSKILRDITDRKRHEKELHERDRMYQAIGDSIKYGIFVCDADGDNIHSSKSFLELIGLTQEECSAMGWAGSLHPADAQRTILSWRKSVKEGTLWASEHRYKAVDGQWYHVLARGVPFRDDQGELKGWVGINLDITEQKRMEAALRESETRFQMLADNMDQLAWISRADGREVWLNQRWEEFTGFPREQINDRLSEIYHPEHFHRVISHVKEQQEKGEAWELTYPMKSAKGQYRWFLSRAVPLCDEEGRLMNWFGTCTDITDRMKAENELRKTDRRKDHFLATLAHELRNPLAPLRSGVEVLSFSAEDPQTVKTTSSIMERQVGHMVRLIDDLMDLGRISTGRLILRRETMALGKAIDMAVEAVEPIMKQHQHEFSVVRPEKTLFMHGDAARITQVISNLLHNAAKYTDKGGTIQLSVEKDGDEAVVTVSDNGTGIEPELLGNVFDMFSQIEKEQRSQRGGGLGIGLHIVQRLITMHGGSIEATSEGKGKGSAFVVRLPLLEHADTGNGAETDGEENTKRITKKVLIVDDDPDAPLILSMLLNTMGCDTRTAHEGEDAIRVAENFKPDIVLLDIEMPGMDGYEVCEKLRAHRWGKKMCIYALTGHGQEADRHRSQEAGFDDHLVKPVGRAELKGLLAGSLSAGTAE